MTRNSPVSGGCTDGEGGDEGGDGPAAVPADSSVAALSAVTATPLCDCCSWGDCSPLASDDEAALASGEEEGAGGTGTLSKK